MSAPLAAIIIIAIVFGLLGAVAASALTAIAYNLSRIADELATDRLEEERDGARPLFAEPEPPRSSTGVPLPRHPVEALRGRDWKGPHQ